MKNRENDINTQVWKILSMLLVLAGLTCVSSISLNEGINKWVLAIVGFLFVVGPLFYWMEIRNWGNRKRTSED